MAEFAKRARDLVKEVSNYDALALPAFNEELVRLALSEVHEHNDRAQLVLGRIQELQDMDADQGVLSPTSQQRQQEADAVAYVVHLQSMARSKCLLLSYMLQRFERLKSIRWQHRALPPAVESMCSQQEAEMYKSYDRLLTQHMSKHQGIGHDLTLDCQPPQDNMVQVRVLKDAGAHMFSFGRMALVQGALLRLPSDEAEPFIKSGVLQLHNRSEFL